MGTFKRYDIAIIFPDWYHFLHEVEFPKGYQPDGILVSYDDEHFDASWLDGYGVPVVNIFAHGRNQFSTIGACSRSLAKVIVDQFDRRSSD